MKAIKCFQKYILFKKIIIIAIVISVAVPVINNGFAQSISAGRYTKAKGYFKQGLYFFNNMNYLAGVEFFRKAVAVYPEYHTAREYLARSYRLAGYVDEALTEWEMLYETARNPLVKSKIDNLRFLEIKSTYKNSYDEYVLADTIISSGMGRFHFSYPVDLVIDNSKNIYITSFSTGKVIKLATNKQGLLARTADFNSKAYGIDYFDNHIAYTDFGRDMFYITDTDLNPIFSAGKSGKEEGEFHGPQGIAFDRKGYLYIVDSGNNRIQKFSPQAKFVHSFGRSGNYEGELKNPTDVAIFKNQIFVTDTGNNRIAIFDESGNFISNLKISGMKSPRGIFIQGQKIFISDEKAGLLIYNRESKKVKIFNSWNKKKQKFSRLFATAQDQDGYLYSIDHNKERIYIFAPLQKHYSNIDIEIISVDMSKFPVLAFYVNIRNKDGSPIYGLKRDYFQITEDKAQMRGIYINYLKDKNKSTTIALCVDRSKSAEGWHNDMAWVSEFILKKLHKNDRLKVINFNNHIWTGNKFDWSRRRALRAIKKRKYNSGKNMGKALYNAIADIAGKENRRAVVMITDGSVNQYSFQQYNEKNIINYANAHFIPVYFICFKEKNAALKRIAQKTGGGIYKASEVDSLRKIYSKIKNAEEQRYVIVYSTFKDDRYKNIWSDVSIEINMRGQKGIEWGGYFVPK